VTIVVGTPMPILERPITLAQMVVYSGATWDWYRIHYDTEFAHGKGLAAPVVDGQMFGALFAKQVQDWLGPQCFLRELEFRNRNLMFAGETVRIGGQIESLETDRVRVSMTATILASEYGLERPAVSGAFAIVGLGHVDGLAES
jgi:acyl dehydratase